MVRYDSYIIALIVSVTESQAAFALMGQCAVIQRLICVMVYVYYSAYCISLY